MKWISIILFCYIYSNHGKGLGILEKKNPKNKKFKNKRKNRISNVIFWTICFQNQINKFVKINYVGVQ